jgi:hypothetical protein
MLSTYALKQDVGSVLKKINEEMKDLPVGSDIKVLRKSYNAARERLEKLGEVMLFGIDMDVNTGVAGSDVGFEHAGYNITFTIGGRYNVVSEVRKRGPTRACYCSTVLRAARGSVFEESNSAAGCDRHQLTLSTTKAGNKIGNILKKYEDSSTSLYVGSGRHGWKSGICEGNTKVWQLGVSPRKQTKLWELELGELLAAQRKLIGHLRAAER